MTAIYYGDLDAVSPNGRYALEARSPHNGTIPHRDGRAVDESDYRFRCRDHQREFRYRLIDNARGATVWERWQDEREDSPGELIVSDDGWAVVGTDGYSPEILVVSPGGANVLRVEIVGACDGEGLGKDELEEAAAERQPNAVTWRADRLSFTTAGVMWDGNSWRYFFRVGDSAYFAWRTAWGQRLVIDLGRAEIVDEEGQAEPEIAHAAREEESRGATALLAEVAARAGEVFAMLDRPAESEADAEVPFVACIYRVSAAANLVGVHRIAYCEPHLRRLELIEGPWSSTSSRVFGRPWMLETHWFRPIVQHALRLIDGNPRGLPAYRFGRDSDDLIDEILPDADRPNVRADRTSVTPAMDPQQILALLGSPDHVRSESYPAGIGFRCAEEWEYDFRESMEWVTLRVVWDAGDGTASIVRVEEAPSYWLDSDRRASEILRY